MRTSQYHRRSLIVRPFITACLLLCSSYHAHGANVQLNANSLSEIQHLIDTVAASPCQLIRNGRSHSAADAVAHMQKKFDYFRDEIHSAETFIKFSASKSTFSGKPYLIKCPNKTAVRSRDWLLNTLNQFRTIHK